jgi:hypothetical protein
VDGVDGTTPDMSDYATVTELEALDGRVTELEANGGGGGTGGGSVDLSDYVQKTDIFRTADMTKDINIGGAFHQFGSGDTLGSITDNTNVVIGGEIGARASTTVGNFTVVGKTIMAETSGATAIGYGVIAAGANATAVGFQTHAEAHNATVVGYNAKARQSDSNNVVIGGNNVVIGNGAVSLGNRSVIVGSAVKEAKPDPNPSNYHPTENVVIGEDIEMYGTQNVVVGTNVGSLPLTTTGSVSVGHSARTEVDNSVAVGAGAFVGPAGINSVAVGAGAAVNGKDSVVIGRNAKTVLDEDGDEPYHVLIMGSDVVVNGYRAIAIGRRINVAENSIVLGMTKDYDEDENGVPDDPPTTFPPSTLAIGHRIVAHGEDSVLIGNSAKETVDSSTDPSGENVLIGRSAEAYNAANSVAIGYNCGCGDSSVVIGSQAWGEQDFNVVIGHRAHVNGTNCVCIGRDATTDTDNHILIGNGEQRVVEIGFLHFTLVGNKLTIQIKGDDPDTGTGDGNIYELEPIA